MLSPINFNVESWNSKQVSSWINGLDKSISNYSINFQNRLITGWELLNLSFNDLSNLKIFKIGHQELIFKAVRKLHNIVYNTISENLSSRLLRLHTSSEQLISILKNYTNVENESYTSFPTNLLVAISLILEEVKLTISWINLLNISNNHKFGKYMKEIVNISLEIISLTKVSYSSNTKATLIQMCLQIKSISDNLQHNCSDSSIMLSTSLEKITLNKIANEELGLIITTENDMSIIESILPETAADRCEKFDAYDQIIQINDQIVVSWQLDNVISFIQSCDDKIIFIIQKSPRHELSFKSGQMLLNKKHKNHACSAEDILHINETIKRLSSSTENIQIEELSPSWAPNISAFIPSNQIIDLIKDENDNSLPNSRKYFSLGRRHKKGINSLFSLSPPENLNVYNSSDSLQSSKLPIRESNSLGKLRHPFSSKRSIVDRQESCKDLGGGECEGWLMHQKHEGSLSSTRWHKFWFVLRKKDLYYYKNEGDIDAIGQIHMPGYTVSPTNEVKSKKFTFKVFNEKSVVHFLAAAKQSDMVKWMNMLGLSSLVNLDTSQLENIAGFTLPSKDMTDHHSTFYNDSYSSGSEMSINNRDDYLQKSMHGSKDDLSGLYRHIRQADLHIDGTDRGARRTTLINSMLGSDSFCDVRQNAMTAKDKNLYLKMLSLERICKDKQNQLEQLEKFLANEPISSDMIRLFKQDHSNLELYVARESLV